MCVAGWTSSRADCEARAVAEVEDVVEQVLLRPKRDVAGASAAEAEKRRGWASAAGAEERRGRAGAAGAEKRRGRASAAGAEERRGRASCCGRRESGPGELLGGPGGTWPGAELVGRGSEERERDERTARWDGCAGGKSERDERERRCRESPKNKGVPKHRCSVLAQ